MCGLAGILNLNQEIYPSLDKHLNVMNELQVHRGPDEEGIWKHEKEFIGLASRRLSIIDLETGNQPMTDESGNWIVYNGEIYNYLELRKELGENNFTTNSDTEVILKAYHKWGKDCVNHFKGMFAIALWDESKQQLFCARDRFGIKPFYYTSINNTFYFASETKALLPFLSEIRTNLKSIKDYFVYQFCLKGETLFQDINELQPAHTLSITKGEIHTERYWEISYDIDFSLSEQYCVDRLRDLIEESVKMHLRSDVPVGTYLSGGIDSSSLAAIASKSIDNTDFYGFTGKFSSFGNSYDESDYAKTLANEKGLTLQEVDINSQDFINNIRKVIYHLDYPVAGPGAFPQYMVSQLAAKQRKVTLSGLGGDEIFGGYVRYLIAYFEQCISGAIDGTLNKGNFVVTYDSLLKNLTYLHSYKPLLKEFFRNGLFDQMGYRYFSLINKAKNLRREINWDVLKEYSTKDSFEKIFYGKKDQKESYFDLMTRFDFKTLLPALLQVEDRMSMAHGLESRVPFLDQDIVEFASKIPADIKFKEGKLKRILIEAVKDVVPESIIDRQDKMGFPVPFTEWLRSDIRDFVYDIFQIQKKKHREIFNTYEIMKSLEKEPKFGRKIWGLLSLELWHQEFHDKSHYYKNLL